MPTPKPSKAAVRGHPIHPALVPYPIALLSAALFTDIAYWFDGDAQWAVASAWLLGAGVLLALVAMVPGVIDYLGIPGVREHRVARLHLIANVALTALGMVNALLRLGDPAGAVLPFGLALSALTAGMLGLSGWLGGELAYRHLIGVNPDRSG